MTKRAVSRTRGSVPETVRLTPVPPRSGGVSSREMQSARRCPIGAGRAAGLSERCANMSDLRRYTFIWCDAPKRRFNAGSVGRPDGFACVMPIGGIALDGFPPGALPRPTSPNSPQSVIFRAPEVVAGRLHGNSAHYRSRETVRTSVARCRLRPDHPDARIGFRTNGIAPLGLTPPFGGGMTRSRGPCSGPKGE